MKRSISKSMKPWSTATSLTCGMDEAKQRKGDENWLLPTHILFLSKAETNLPENK